VGGASDVAAVTIGIGIPKMANAGHFRFNSKMTTTEKNTGVHIKNKWPARGHH
jgi:hypothetical protein